MTNNEKILQAVLLDDKLMEFGGYTAEDIGNIYQAIDSDNCVISAVAQIISRTNEGATERELWKEINDYIKRNVLESNKSISKTSEAIMVRITILSFLMASR